MKAKFYCSKCHRHLGTYEGEPFWLLATPLLADEPVEYDVVELKRLCTECYRELKLTIASDLAGRVAIDKFCQWGFFEKHYAGKRLEYRVKISPQQAREKGLLKINEV